MAKDNFYYTEEEAEVQRNKRSWSEMDNQYLQPYVDTKYIKMADYAKLASYFSCSPDTLNMQIQHLRREQENNIENTITP